MQREARGARREHEWHERAVHTYAPPAYYAAPRSAYYVPPAAYEAPGLSIGFGFR